MITLLTIFTALGCLFLMAIILIQDPKTGNLNTRVRNSGIYSLINQGKSSLVMERATWTIASVLMVLCIITAILT